MKSLYGLERLNMRASREVVVRIDIQGHYRFLGEHGVPREVSSIVLGSFATAWRNCLFVGRKRYIVRHAEILNPGLLKPFIKMAALLPSSAPTLRRPLVDQPRPLSGDINKNNFVPLPRKPAEGRRGSDFGK
mgnify:CR=1 FL=1